MIEVLSFLTCCSILIKAPFLIRSSRIPPTPIFYPIDAFGFAKHPGHDMEICLFFDLQTHSLCAVGQVHHTRQAWTNVLAVAPERLLTLWWLGWRPQIWHLQPFASHKWRPCRMF